MNIRDYYIPQAGMKRSLGEGERELIFVIIFIRNRIYNIFQTPANGCLGRQEIISAKREKKQQRKNKRSPLFSTIETSGWEATCLVYCS